MWDTNGSKIKHMFKNVSRHSQKSGKKFKKAIERYILILRKEAKEATKWVFKTKFRAEARLKKMRITERQINDALKRKGLDHLIKNHDAK